MQEPLLAEVEADLIFLGLPSSFKANFGARGLLAVSGYQALGCPPREYLPNTFKYQVAYLEYQCKYNFIIPFHRVPEVIVEEEWGTMGMVSG